MYGPCALSVRCLPTTRRTSRHVAVCATSMMREQISDFNDEDALANVTTDNVYCAPVVRSQAFASTRPIYQQIRANINTHI
eukprot:scaffold428018_cov16-Prasinocladus_malaysianus.AAC.1